MRLLRIAARFARLAAPWSTAVNPHQTRQENTMIMKRTRAVVLIGASFYMSVMGFAGGIAAERIRFDRQRTAVLHRYDEAVQQWHQFLMAAEQRRAEAGFVAGDAAQVVR
jgi:hypothetical protein